MDIRWGHNKEHLPLKQTLEVIVYSLTSHLPIYYLELPGNMPDSRTIEMIVTELIEEYEIIFLLIANTRLTLDVQ